MKAAIKLAVGVWLVAGVDDRTALHGVHALEFGEEIAALRDLKPWTNELVFFFPTELASAADDLARHEERDHRRAQHVPREFARHQVVLMATVAVAAKVGVVLIEQDWIVRVLVDVFDARHEERVASVILLEKLEQVAAFR